jgi:hypothetical protein
MVAISPNLKYGPYENHTFANPDSPFAPFALLTCLPQGGFVKSCNDQSMLSHITFGIPHGILYLISENFDWNPKPIKYHVRKCICCSFTITI